MWEVGRQGSTPCHRRHRHVRGREGHGKQVIAAAAAASTFGRPFAQTPATAPALQSVCARGARALPASSIRRIRRGRPTVACAPSRRHASGRLRKRRRAGGGAVPPTAGGARCRAAIPPARTARRAQRTATRGRGMVGKRGAVAGQPLQTATGSTPRGRQRGSVQRGNERAQRTRGGRSGVGSAAAPRPSQRPGPGERAGCWSVDRHCGRRSDGLS